MVLSNLVCVSASFKLDARENDGKGKPITQLRNVQAGAYRTGRIKEPYFSPLNPLATSHIKDEYLEEPVRLLKEQNKTFQEKNNNDVNFVPASGTGNSLLYKSNYKDLKLHMNILKKISLFQSQKETGKKTEESN